MNLNRVTSIDALRGFALLGILLVNMMHFQYATESKDVISQYPFFSEEIFYSIKILLQGSFLSMFAFIFGFSIMKFYQSRVVKQISFKLPLIKRGIALFLLGLIHYIFIWEGDILTSYGFMIIVVVFFVNSSEKVLKILALVMFVFYLLLNTVMRLSAESSILQQSQMLDSQLYASGTYVDMLNNRLLFGLDSVLGSHIVNFIVHIMNVTTVPIVLLPFAIIGMIVAKRDYEGKQAFKSIGARYFVPLVIVGVLLKSALLFNNFGGMFLLSIGAAVLTFGYIYLFLFGYEKLFHSRIKLAFESIGKMSISNYIFQSIVLTTLFANYGFGLAGKVGLLYGCLIAIALYVSQAILSLLYFKFFKQGPLEYVIRLWIYSGDKKSQQNKSKTTISG